MGDHLSELRVRPIGRREFQDADEEAQPDIEFVTEQAPPLGKVDAGAVVQAVDDAKPDAIFNVLFGPDLAKFVREGNTRGVFKDRFVVSLLSGEPEYLDPLKEDTPVGWVVTGYPWDEIKTPGTRKFVAAYRKRWNDYPRLGSVVGYDTMKSLAAGIAKAGSTDTEAMIKAFRGLKVDGGAFGPFYGHDLQSPAAADALQRLQGGRASHDPLDRCRMGAAWRAGQRGRPDLHRNADGPGEPRERASHRRVAAGHADGPHGTGRRSRQRRALLGLRCVQPDDGSRCPGRWRLHLLVG